MDLLYSGEGGSGGIYEYVKENTALDVCQAGSFVWAERMDLPAGTKRQ